MPGEQLTEAEQELEERRFRIRHSTAHVMADAVLQLFPEAKYAIGPPIRGRLLLRLRVSRPFTPEDLSAIELVCASASPRTIRSSSAR